MKQHAIMSAAAVLFVIGCATSPSEKELAEDERFFEKVGACGEGKTISRTVLGYTGKYFPFNSTICYIKICDDGNTIFVVDELRIDETECAIELKRIDQ